MRGSVMDLFFWGVLAITLGVGLYVLYGVTSSMMTTCEQVQVSIGAPTYASDACTQTRAAVGNLLNMYGFIMFFAGLAIIVHANMTSAPASQTVIGLLLWIIAIVIFGQISNAFSGLFNDSFFLPIKTAYPLPAVILANMHWFVAVFGAILLAVLYRSRAGTGGSGRPEG